MSAWVSSNRNLTWRCPGNGKFLWLLCPTNWGTSRNCKFPPPLSLLTNPPNPDSIFFLDLTFCPICSTLAPYGPWAPNQRKPEGKENEASCHLGCHLPRDRRDYKHTLNSSSWKSRLEAILCRVHHRDLTHLDAGTTPPHCFMHPHAPPPPSLGKGSAYKTLFSQPMLSHISSSFSLQSPATSWHSNLTLHPSDSAGWAVLTKPLIPYVKMSHTILNILFGKK